MNPQPLLVTCLCAAWCTTCDAYRATFAALAGARPDLRFAWIDIEDDADALGETALDIENFPTVQIQQDGRVLFHGTLLPQPGALTALLDAHARGALSPGEARRVPQTMATAIGRLAESRRILRAG
jgi:thiol-disulfide isomerase/thioredoxin